MNIARKIFGVLIYWPLWPIFYFMLSDSHRTRVIISVNNKVLFVSKWLGESRLSLPGGGVKDGETSKQAAIREVYEETGIKLRVEELKSIITNIQVKSGGIKYLVDCYSVILPEIVEAASHHFEIYDLSWQNWQSALKNNRLSDSTELLLQTWLSNQHLID